MLISTWPVPEEKKYASKHSYQGPPLLLFSIVVDFFLALQSLNHKFPRIWNMAKQNDDSHGVDKTTQQVRRQLLHFGRKCCSCCPPSAIFVCIWQLFGPIRHLCTYVNELSKVVASKVPNHEDVAEAKRRGEFTMGQIIAVRQVENRMDVDQVWL